MRKLLAGGYNHMAKGDVMSLVCFVMCSLRWHLAEGHMMANFWYARTQYCSAAGCEHLQLQSTSKSMVNGAHMTGSRHVWTDAR
jgi:hypothetical protein